MPFTILKRPAYKILNGILMKGQSNEEGGDNTGSAVIGTTQLQKALIYYKPNDNSSTDNGSMQSLMSSINNIWRPATVGAVVGPESGFGKSWSDEHIDPIIILKYGYGGSGLVDAGAALPNGCWQIDSVNAQPHYRLSVDNFDIPALKKLKAAGYLVNIKALHWCQGEAEANDVTGKYLTYQYELTRLINQVNIDLAPYIANPGGIKLIITRIHNNFSPARPFQNEVRAAQVATASALNMPYIDSDAYAVASDFVHWTKIAQNQHGIDVYNIYKTLL